MRLDAMLKEFAPKLKLSSEAATVEGLLEDLESRYPRLKFRLRDELGHVRPFVRVFVNGEEIGGLGGLATPLGSTDSIDILHSIQGG
ncbi:MAG TPA: MoaD/ThiS family protein [Thermoplasmata archaeon]